jgi:sulfotransferase
MNKKIFYLSGLPRSGSTLLSSILEQNLNFHIEGNSPVCQMMWDLHFSINYNCEEQIFANNKIDVANNIVSSIPFLYYKNSKKPYVLDKCRSWTSYENINIIKKYIDLNPKIIILIRDITEIVKSFIKIDPYTNWEKIIFNNNSDPLIKSINGIFSIKEHDLKHCIFIFYDDLIYNTENVIEKIYNFLEIDFFNHNLNKIEQKYIENDNFYNVKNFHKVRPIIEKKNYDIKLNFNSIKICKELNKKINEKCFTKLI